jgi:hypothetical protein
MIGCFSNVTFDMTRYGGLLNVSVQAKFQTFLFSLTLEDHTKMMMKVELIYNLYKIACDRLMAEI